MTTNEYTKPTMNIIALAGADIVRTSAGDNDVNPFNPNPQIGVLNN